MLTRRDFTGLIRAALAWPQIGSRISAQTTPAQSRVAKPKTSVMMWTLNRIGTFEVARGLIDARILLILTCEHVLTHSILLQCSKACSRCQSLWGSQVIVMRLEVLLNAQIVH